MNETSIIQLLQAGVLADGSIQANEILSKETNSVQDSSSKFAARLLAVLNKQGRFITEDNVEPVVKCVLQCYTVLESHPIEWKHPLDLEKYIYNFTVIIIKRDFLKHVFTLSKRLLEDFKVNYHKEPQSAKTMCDNLYYNLWDCSNNLKTLSDNSFQLVFQIRSLAVNFSLLTGSVLLSCHEKVILILEKLDSSIGKTKNVGQYSLLKFGEDVKLWCEDVCSAYLKGTSLSDNVSVAEDEKVQRISCAVELLFKVMKFLNKWDSSNDAEKLAKNMLDVLSQQTLSMKLHTNLTTVPLTIIESMKSVSFSTPAFILEKAEYLVNHIKKIKNIISQTQVIYLCKTVASFLYYLVHILKSPQTQFSTSVGVTMTAYSNLKWEELSIMEKIYIKLKEVADQELQAYLNNSHARKQNTDSNNRAAKRIKQLVLNCVIDLSDSVYIAASRIHKQDKSPSEKNEMSRIIQMCDQHTKEISESLCRKIPGVKLSYDEHLHCGFLLHKVGRIISNRSSHKQSVPFYKLGLHHYKLWNKQATTAEKRKQPIHQRYDAFVQVLRKASFFEEAMATACEMLLLSSSHLASVADMWQVIKYDISKQKGPTDKLIMRTMWQEVQSLCVSTGQKCTIHPEKIYAAELKATKEKEVCPSDGKNVLIDQYLHVVRTPALKARLILDKTEIAWIKRKPKYGDPVALVHEALELLNSSDKTLPTYWDDMANTYVMMYIVQDVDLQQMEQARDKRRQKDKEKESASQRLDSPLEGLEEAELYQDAVTIEDEQTSMISALQALECWRNIEKPSAKSYRDRQTTLQSMMLLAEIFKLLCWTKQESQILELIIPMCKQSGAASEHASILVHATFNFCCLLNSSTQPHIALAFLRETESFLDKNEMDDVKETQLYFQFQGVWSETHLLLNEVEEGWAHLKKALNLKENHIRRRTKEDLELEGYLRRIQARYLSLPHSHWPNGPPDSKEWALDLIIRGARSIGGVICSTLGSSFINSTEGLKVNAIAMNNVLEKWSLLNQVLDVFQEIGTVFLQLGDARDAKCYLQQGLFITQAMKLPKRLAYFHLLMARLDNICGKFQDSRAHLHTVAYILNSKASAIETKNANKASADNQISLEDNSSMNDSKTGGDNPFEIKSQSLEFEEHLNQYPDNRPVEKAASPKHHKEQFEVPDFWSHEVECECKLCCDVDSVRLGLLYVLSYSELYIMEGKHQTGRQYVLMLLGKIEHFTNKTSKILETMVTGNIKNLNKKCGVGNKGSKETTDVIRSCTFQSIAIEACKLMVYMALVDLDLKAHQEWTQRMQSLLKLDCYPWMVTAWVDMAESHQLGVTPSLPWPPGLGPSLDVFDVLCKEVEDLGLNTEEVKNCATPIIAAGSSAAKVRSRIAMNKAPVKKKRGVFGTVLDIPDCSEPNISSTDSPLGEIVSNSKSALLLKLENSLYDSNMTKQSTNKPKLNKQLDTCKDESNSEINNTTKDVNNGKLPGTIISKKSNGTKSKVTRQKNVAEDSAMTINKTKRSVSKIGKVTDKAPVKKQKVAKTQKAPALKPNSKFNLPAMHLLLDSPEQKFKIFTEKPTSIKPSLKAMTDEEVYNFICSSPDITPLVKKKPGRKITRKTSTAAKCQKQDSEESVQDVNKTNKKSRTNRVTRSKTEVEGQRYDSDCESDELVPEIDVSGIMIVPDNVTLSPDHSSMSLGDSPMIERKILDVSVESPVMLATHEVSNVVSPAVLPPEVEFSPMEVARGTRVEHYRATAMENVIPIQQLSQDHSEVGSNEKKELLMDIGEEIELARQGDSDDGSDLENRPPPPSTVKIGKSAGASSKKVHGTKKQMATESGVEMPRKTVLKARDKSSVQGGRGDSTDTLIAKVDKLAITSPQKALMKPSGSEIKQHLLHAFNLLKSHPPSVPYRNVCHALATLEINDGNDLGAVFYITEAQSVIFRHSALMNISKKIRKLSTMTQGLAHLNEQTVKQRLYEVGDVLAFNKTEDQIIKAARDIPQGWTVCQVSVLKSPSQESGEMFMTHMSSGQPLLLHRLPGFATANGQKIFIEFDDMMRENTVSMHVTERKEWWSRRMALNNKFTVILEDIVSIWLGGLKCLLLGLPNDQSDMEKLQAATEDFCNEFEAEEKFTDHKKGLIKVILNGCHMLQERELIQMICEVTSRHHPTYIHRLSKELRSRSDKLNHNPLERKPVILILDRLVQHFPWECLTFMRNQPVSRVPNLYFLQSLLQQQITDPNSLYNTGMDPHDTYFILDPEANLLSTQETFKDWFQKQEGWKGIIGKIPNLEEYKMGLTRDLFLYCGHGGGNRFLSGDIIQTMQCRSCAMIMGCSSGKLTVLGNLEACGLMLNYFLAGCPSIIGNLWDVTDKDIDRFTEELLKAWLEAKDGTCITEPFEKSRQVCRLPNLIGAAPVVYGLPLKIKRKNKLNR